LPVAIGMSHLQRGPIDIAGVVSAQRSKLREFIETDYGLLRELLALSVLNYQQVEIIQQESLKNSRVDKLLDYITRISHELQKKLLLALYKNGQIHVNNFILANGHRTTEDGENWPLGDDRKVDILFSKWPELSTNIDTQNGLLDELLSVGCINEEQKQNVEVKNIKAKRNEALLGILLRRGVGDYTKFVGCLVKTKQFQVTCSLEAGTLVGHTPLNEVQRSTLIRNRSTLVRLIENRHGLVEQMYADDCITWQQKDFIETASSQPQRNMRLLDIVERGSQSDFNKFLKYLEATKQEHICNILITDPAVALVVAKTGCARMLVYNRTRSLVNSCKKNVNEDERLIVQRFKSLLSRSSGKRREQLHDDINQFVMELQNRDVQLIAANRHSIELYFACMSLDGLFYLECVYLSGELSVLLGSIFTALLDNVRCVTVRSLVWKSANYVECAQHLYSGTGLVLHREMYQLLRCNHNLRTDTLSMHHALRIDLLPLEQKEILLFKALGQLHVMFNKLTPKAEMFTLISLSSVSKVWWRTIFSRIFYLQSLQHYFSRVCHPFKSIPQQLESLHIENQLVNGVAEFNYKLFAICEGSTTVHVFNSSSPFNRLENIELRGLIDPLDIVVCSDTSQLYIADCQQCAIWRVNLLSYKQVDKFISTQWQPYSLSTKSRRLLITPGDGDALFIYGDDGVLLKHIQLPRYMNATHAMETTHNTYIVSYLSRLGDTLLSEYESVSEIDINGRVVRIFDSQHNDIGSIQFNKPLYLALAGNNHVIVADSYNERIVVLNEDLQLKRVLINSSHGQQPARLYLSQRTGLLFIAMDQSSDIHVYDVLQI
jgi:hypothetical protein